MDGVPWAVLVSSQGGRLVVGPERHPIGTVNRKPSSLGFGPVSIGYVTALGERRVFIHGTALRAMDHVRIEDEAGRDMEVAVVGASDDLGCTVFLALPRRRPVRLIGTLRNGDGAFLNLDPLASRFTFLE